MEDEMTMHEVSKDDFHAWLKGEKRDVHPRLIGNKWPYTSLFTTKSGKVLGKIETYIPEGSALSKNRYFLTGNVHIIDTRKSEVEQGRK